MKHIASVTLMLNFAITGMYAQPSTVNMTFSGTAGASAISLQQPNARTSEEIVAGNGTLGSFTFRNVTATSNSPASLPPSTCSGATHLYFQRVAGAGIFRFQDGSLLNVSLTQGADCIDLVANEGHCILTLQVTGGTGRFKHASGVLTYTETALPVLSDYYSNPVYFDESGELTGTVSGVTAGDGPQGTQR